MGSFRQRSAAAASVARRRDALVMLCVRTRGRMRSVAPSGLSAALQTRTEFTSGASREPSVPRPPGTPRAFVRDRSLASAAALLVGQGALRRPSCAARTRPTRCKLAIGPRRGPATRRRLPATRAARRACSGCPITGRQSSRRQRAQHKCEPWAGSSARP